jgi:hypothetical protein
MADDVYDTTQEAKAFSPEKQENSCDVLLDLATPELYLNHPFRRTGLGVLVGAREIARRTDQLKMSIELGSHEANFAFAKHDRLTVDDIREAAQRLKDPKVRTGYEFFWFWPESYPDESPDPALTDLAAGNVTLAVERWTIAEQANSEVASHNLAIFYHLSALERELGEGIDEELVGNYWQEALRYWVKVRDDDALWERLRRRLANLADPQLPNTMAGQMRETLVNALARIHGALALASADAGRVGRAAMHAMLIATLYQDLEAARRVLETWARPIARRIDAHLAVSRRRIEEEPATGLAEATVAIQKCREEIELVNTLCGRTSEFSREVSHELVDLALDGVVAYQRETHDNRGCLPLLMHLLTREASPELKRRAEHVFEVIRDNVITGESAEIETDVARPLGKPVSDYEKLYLLIVTDIIPGLEYLDFGETARSEDAARVAELLSTLAADAYDKNDNMTLAMKAYATALELPCTEEVNTRLEEARTQLLNDFRVRKEKELLLELEGNVIEIRRRGIRVNELWSIPEEISGLRHGVVSAAVDGALVYSYTIAWISPAGEFVLDERNIFSDPERAESDYTRIVESLYYFMATPLIEQLVARVRKDEPLFFGDCALRRDGWLFMGKGRFSKTQELVPYDRLNYRVEGSELRVASRDNPKWSETYSTVETWNAAIVGYLIDALLQS